MSGHTPGPWATESDGDVGRRTHYVVGGDGLLVRVADVLQEIGVSAVERNANKRLMAAAPELLDALEAAANELWRIPIASTAVLNKARAALAKATGGAL
jgi:hypothetical protein